MSLATIHVATREIRQNVGSHRLGLDAYCHACGRTFDVEEVQYLCDTLTSEWPRKAVTVRCFHLGCGLPAKGGRA